VYDKSVPFEAEIKWMKKETRDTATYAFRIRDSVVRKAYRFEPGQFNMIYVPGIGESAISISSGTMDHDLLHTVRVAGDVTTAVSRMRPGGVVGLRGPFGKGWPLEQGSDDNCRGRRDSAIEVRNETYLSQEKEMPRQGHYYLRVQDSERRYLQE